MSFELEQILCDFIGVGEKHRVCYINNINNVLSKSVAVRKKGFCKIGDQINKHLTTKRKKLSEVRHGRVVGNNVDRTEHNDNIVLPCDIDKFLLHEITSLQLLEIFHRRVMLGMEYMQGVVPLAYPVIIPHFGEENYDSVVLSICGKLNITNGGTHTNTLQDEDILSEYQFSLDGAQYEYVLIK